MSALSTVFMGSDAIALPLLETLYSDYKHCVKLDGVFTQPDRPKGRGMQLRANPVKQWAVEKGIPIVQPRKIGAREYDWLREQRCELIFVMAYGHLLSETLLALPRRGIYNFHTSLLPAYRGASPIHTAIVNGETVTGVTLMAIEKAMDAGAIIDQEKIPIALEDTAAEVYPKAAKACVPLIERNLQAITSASVNRTPQKHEQATYCRCLKKGDGAIDFHKPAHVLHNRIRGLHPWPGTFFQYETMLIKIGKASFAETSVTDAPGVVIGVENQRIAVATGQGILFLHELQRPGGKMIDARAFLAGCAIKPGVVLQSQPMPHLLTPPGYATTH